MEKEKIIEIMEDIENKSNRDLFSVSDFLYEEFNNTKELIINLTRHLETVEEMYNKVLAEVEKRGK